MVSQWRFQASILNPIYVIFGFVWTISFRTFTFKTHDGFYTLNANVKMIKHTIISFPTHTNATTIFKPVWFLRILTSLHGESRQINVQPRVCFTFLRGFIACVFALVLASVYFDLESPVQKLMWTDRQTNMAAVDTQQKTISAHHNRRMIILRPTKCKQPLQ